MSTATRILRRLVIAATAIVATSAASAATVTFNNVANSQVRNSIYVGLYSLTIDSQTLLALCDSVNSHVNPPVTWDADIWSYADIQAGAVGKFNSPLTPATLTQYSQAGWLYSQLSVLAPNDYSGQADVQEAIWKVMAPSYALVGAGATAYYTAATSGAYDAYDWSAVMRVVTPNPLAQQSIDVQEYLISAVPVPAAAWLFGSAVAGLGWIRRRQAA